ncbi:hypothetical protein ABMA27_017019 [Loxostege sticticalis]|uniref:Reverse transcriptase domain-containing protein n=1 Tax=Loxostege sticticalis TaxID=481309 RepID=A0ABR3GYI9_LOXSC
MADKGIVIGAKNLTNLRFADDIVLFAETPSQIQKMLEELSTASLEVGLEMNRSKTKIMTNRAKSRVTVDGKEMQYVDEYIYLGQLVSFDNRQEKEIQRRIDNAWKSYWSMKTLMKGDLPLSLKRKLVDVCILPVLTYGAQTAIERSILGIKRTDKVRNTSIRSKTGIVDVGVKAAKLKWEWAGHVCRMHPDKWTQIVTQWTPEDGYRRRGRPKKRWHDDLVNHAGDWQALALNRDAWKDLGETFAQKWDTTG